MTYSQNIRFHLANWTAFWFEASLMTLAFCPVFSVTPYQTHPLNCLLKLQFPLSAAPHRSHYYTLKSHFLPVPGSRCPDHWIKAFPEFVLESENQFSQICQWQNSLCFLGLEYIRFNHITVLKFYCHKFLLLNSKNNFSMKVITVLIDTLLKIYWDNRNKYQSPLCIPFSLWVFLALENAFTISVSGRRRRIHIELGIGCFTWLLLHPSWFRQLNHTASNTHPFYSGGNNGYACECKRKIRMNAHFPLQTNTYISPFK